MDKRLEIAHLTIKFYELTDRKAQLEQEIEAVRAELAQLGERVGRKPSSLKGKKLELKPCPVEGCKAEPSARRRWRYYCKRHQSKHKPSSKQAS